MRILYVVQRYGEKIVGGSETACRLFAEHLVDRGHQVDVLTSCAHNYVDWADEYAPGTETINGVTVHRRSVTETRTEDRFGAVHPWMMNHPKLASRFDQIRWARLMGPQLEGQREWLLDNAHHFDVTVFMTYLYATTTFGLPTVAGRVPTVLQPTAHDEPAAYVDYFNAVFRLPDAFIFFTPEEREIVTNIYRIEPEGAVVGIGIDNPSQESTGTEVLRRYQLTGEKYLLYVGRIDESKGVGELLRFFDAYRTRNGNRTKLVLVGDPVMEVPVDDDIVVVGFVGDEEKSSLIAGSIALVQPSYFESFSIVLCEAWQQGRPALVQGRCAVLRGQALRSNGALPYEGFAQFEALVNLLIDDPGMADELGAAGREYVRRNYNWAIVMDRFEETLTLAAHRFRSRRIVTSPSA